MNTTENITIFKLENELVESDIYSKEHENWPDDVITLKIHRKAFKKVGSKNYNVSWEVKIIWTFYVDGDVDDYGRSFSYSGWSVNIQSSVESIHWTDNKKLIDIIASTETPLDILPELQKLFRKHQIIDRRQPRYETKLKKQR